MTRIDRSDFVGTTSNNEAILPGSANASCPHCKRKVHFLITWKISLNKVANYSTNTCPSCQGVVRFIFLVDSNDPKNLNKGELYMNPGSKERSKLEGINENDKLPDSLKKAYISAVNVYNLGEWAATSVLCRKVLEGIMHTLLPDMKGNISLAKRLECLPEKINLNQPIITLADAIRKGGNIGAHFDLEKEPNEEISKLMIDLLDYLIEYLFILPARIETLHEKIEHLSNKH